MATSTANVTTGYDVVTPGTMTAQQAEDVVEKMTIGDLDRSHVASNASIPEIGTTAPSTSLVTGEIWVDTTDPDAGGTTKVHTAKSYNGSTFRPVVAWHIGATAPTFTAGNGMLWWDTTNNLARIYDTIDGIAGWHPVDRRVRLMTNGNASTCPAGGVVIQDPGATGSFEMTTVKKHMGVIGVALESIAAAASGLVAMVGSGMEVEVLCDDASADDTVAAGDFLGTFSVIGEARGLGPQVLDPNIGTAAISEGTPCGAFAVALEAKDVTTHLARSVLLDQVGRGAWRYITPTEVIDEGDFAVSGSWAEADMNNTPVTSATIAADAGHLPLLAVRFDVNLAHTADNNYVDITVDLSPDRTALRSVKLVGATNSLQSRNTYMNIDVPTKSNNADSYASLGNYIQFRKTETAETLDDAVIRAVAYLY